VSQRQKTVTNEKRARRLGTGEGIAREKRPMRGAGGGVPGWAWVVGGAIVIAAIAIAAALVVTRGSSSGADQQSSIVTDRLATDRPDFVSVGTWQPNYDNLQAALQALHMPGLSQSVEHYHVHVKLIVEGHQIPIPANIGLDSVTQTASPIHTHDERGVIHIEADTKGFRATLLDVFDIWGVRINDRCVGGFCNGVKVYIDGKLITNDPLNHDLVQHDAVTIVEGTPPKGFTPDKTYKFQPGE
jgi:hypothetical protein